MNAGTAFRRTIRLPITAAFLSPLPFNAFITKRLNAPFNAELKVRIKDSGYAHELLLKLLSQHINTRTSSFSYQDNMNPNKKRTLGNENSGVENMAADAGLSVYPPSPVAPAITEDDSSSTSPAAANTAVPTTPVVSAVVPQREMTTVYFALVALVPQRDNQSVVLTGASSQLHTLSTPAHLQVRVSKSLLLGSAAYQIAVRVPAREQAAALLVSEWNANPNRQRFGRLVLPDQPALPVEAQVFLIHLRLEEAKIPAVSSAQVLDTFAGFGFRGNSLLDAVPRTWGTFDILVNGVSNFAAIARFLEDEMGGGCLISNLLFVVDIPATTWDKFFPGRVKCVLEPVLLQLNPHELERMMAEFGMEASVVPMHGKRPRFVAYVAAAQKSLMDELIARGKCSYNDSPIVVRAWVEDKTTYLQAAEKAREGAKSHSRQSDNASGRRGSPKPPAKPADKFAFKTDG